MACVKRLAPKVATVRPPMVRLAILALVMLAGLTRAYALFVFGPNAYTRGHGKPDVYTDGFSRPANAEPGFVIQIFNGNADGTNRVSSGRIEINGVDVAPNELGQHRYEIRKDISYLISSFNEVRIELNGPPGGYLSSVTVASATSGNIVICPVTKVNPGPNGQPQDVQLVWNGGNPISYTIYRSQDAQFRYASVIIAANIVGTPATDCWGNSGAHGFIDVGAAADQKTYFYKVSDGSTSDPPPNQCSTCLPFPEVPRIDLLNPDTGFDGDQIDIQGGGYDGTEPKNNLVSFTGVVGYAQVISASSTVLSVVVPNNVKTGDVSVTVRDVTSNKKRFTVKVPTGAFSFTDLSSIHFQTTPSARFYVAERGTVNKIYRVDLSTSPPTTAQLGGIVGSNSVLSNGRDSSGQLFHASGLEACSNLGRIRAYNSTDSTNILWREIGCDGVGCSPEERTIPKALAVKPGDSDIVYASIERLTCVGTTGDTVWRIPHFGNEPGRDKNFGNTTFNFPSGGTGGGKVSGLAFDNNGNLYATNRTEIKRIKPDETTEVIADNFGDLAGIDVQVFGGVPYILAADRGAGSTDGKVWLIKGDVVLPTINIKSLVATGLNDPRGVAFGSEPTGELYYLVLEPNRIIKLPDPAIVIHDELLCDPKVLLTNAEGTPGCACWPTTLQTEVRKIKIDFTIEPREEARTVFLRVVNDPPDTAPYAVTGINDNKPPGTGTASLSATVVTTDGICGRPPAGQEVFLNIAPDTAAGNNYVVEFGWDVAFTDGPAGATKPITVWRRYFYEHDLMYNLGSDLPFGANASDTTLVVANTAGFSDGDSVIVWDRDFPSQPAHIVFHTVNVLNLATLELQPPGTTLGQDFPSDVGGVPVHPTVTNLTAQALLPLDTSASPLLYAPAFTEWVLASSNNQYFNLPFVRNFEPWPPPYGSAGVYMQARWTQFFDHATKLSDYAWLIASKQWTWPTSGTLGISDGTGPGTLNWSVVNTNEIAIAFPANVPAVTRDVIVHELAHQFGVNPALTGCHDTEPAWCASGAPPTCPGEQCIMDDRPFGAGGRDPTNDIYGFHFTGPQGGDVFEVRDHQEALDAGEPAACP